MSKGGRSLGQKHVDQFGFTSFDTWDAMSSELKRRFGEKAEPILVACDNESTIPYDLKNMDYDTSMFISGSFNSDVYPKICDWIHNNRKLFGKTILEIGCDVGVVTSFLASEFPHSKIVTIDRNADAIEYAKLNCEKLGVNNVEFLCADAKDLSGQEFDTVLSVRTVHENADFEYGPLEFLPMSRKISDATEEYCDCLKRLMKADGKVISIEKMTMDAFFMGYIDSMSNLGLRGNPKTHKELECKCFEDFIHLQTISFTLSCEPVDPMDIFCNCLIHHLKPHQAQYSGRDAVVMFGLTYDKMIVGYEIQNQTDGSIGRYAITTYQGDPTCIARYSNVRGDEFVEHYDVSYKEVLLKDLDETVHPLKLSSGFDVFELDPDFAK